VSKGKTFGLSKNRWMIVVVLFVINASSVIFFPLSWPRQDPFGIAIELVGVAVGSYIPTRILSWVWDSLVGKEKET